MRIDRQAVRWVAATVAGAGMLAAGPLVAVSGAAPSPDLAIAAVYGGGGNSGAPFTNDYVQLFNRGSAPASLSGRSIQYASATGTGNLGANAGQLVVLPEVTLEPGQDFLIQLGGGSTGSPLPTPDATGTIAMSASAGKVALADGVASLGCNGGSAPCSTEQRARIIDLIGYGNATFFEGSAAAPTLSNTIAGARRSAGCQDTDDNAADIETASPAPRNTASPVHACTGSGTPTPTPVPTPTSTPTACSGTVTPIGAVQGTGDISPLSGQGVTVRGTVVGDYETPAPSLRGFYVQDGGDGDPATSDGIFVFTSSSDLAAVGQVVEVSGTASEFQGQTQITPGSGGVQVCSGEGTIGVADITLPRSTPNDLEPYEGMLVRLHQTLTVTEHFQLGRFGQVVVSSGGRLRQPTAAHSAQDEPAAVAALQAANYLNRLIIDDSSQGQNPDPIVFGRGGNPLSATNTLRGGDTVTDPVGVLTYTWAGNSASGNAYRLRPIGAMGGAASFTEADPRPSLPPDVGAGGVRVASANLLNLFNTFTGCTFGVGGPPADCRGAENETEYQRQLAKEVDALRFLDADVVGVMELENDGYGEGSAIRALVDALNAEDGAGAWAYLDPDAATAVTNVAGTDAIKVALLYRTAAVNPVAGATFVDQNAIFERRPVAQTFTGPDGARFTVVVNHFKSKGSCPAASDPDADQGDGQGCWNLRRTAQAEELASFISGTVVPGAGDQDVLIIGDLNAYAGEDPIRALTDAGFTNLIESFGGEEAYSYVFDGQWGYLDHALASASLTPQVSGTGDAHHNADEPTVLDYNTNFKTAGQIASLFAPDRFRSSDHDPVLIGLNLAAPPTPTPTASPAPPSGCLTLRIGPLVVRIGIGCRLGSAVTVQGTPDAGMPGLPVAQYADNRLTLTWLS